MGNIKKIISSKQVKYFVALIGILSSIIGIMQFFSVNTFTKLEGEFCLSNNTDKGRLIELIQKVSATSGEIIYFDNVIIQYDYCSSSESNLFNENTGSYRGRYFIKSEDVTVVYVDDDEQEGFIRYSFYFDGLIDRKNKESYGIVNEEERVKMLFNYHNLSYTDVDLKNFDVMWAYSNSGYNVFLTFNTNDLSNNQYSAINYVQEGNAVLITGPYQVKDRSGGEHIEYELSSPLIDSNEKKKIECTKKNWGKLRKALFCPFI